MNTPENNHFLRIHTHTHTYDFATSNYNSPRNQETIVILQTKTIIFLEIYQKREAKKNKKSFCKRKAAAVSQKKLLLWCENYYEASGGKKEN